MAPGSVAKRGCPPGVSGCRINDLTLEQLLEQVQVHVQEQ